MKETTPKIKQKTTKGAKTRDQNSKINTESKTQKQ